MDPFLEHPHGQGSRGQTAQRRGQPQLIVIAAAGIETDHQRWVAEPLGKVVHIVRQVVAARLLAGFDQDDATGVPDRLVAKRQ